MRGAATRRVTSTRRVSFIQDLASVQPILRLREQQLEVWNLAAQACASPSPRTRIRLRRDHPMHPTAPEWFLDAIQCRSQSCFVEVDGCPIHYQHWTNSGAPALVLIHGYAAHSHWWDFIAPQLLDRYQVVALDLSGCGDSGHRAHYSLERFAREVAAVAEHAELPMPFGVVAHSFGGGVALKTAGQMPKALAGLVLVDSAVVRPPTSGGRRRSIGALPPVLFHDRDTALERFRLVPPQPCANRFLLHHIASHSLRAAEGGWTWKTDPRFLANFVGEDQTDTLMQLQTRLAVLYGSLSTSFRTDVREYMAYVAPAETEFVAVAGAHHHVFLDQPIAFCNQLKTTLAPWWG